MAFKSATTLTATAAITALLLSGCGGGDGDDGTLTIETSAETETDADAPDSGDGSDSGDSGESGEADAGAREATDGTVVLAGATHEYYATCISGTDDLDLMVTGRADAGPFTASFGADDPTDAIVLGIDGVSWRVTSDGTGGEFLALDVDVDAGTVSGSAVFESDSGETAEGTFDFSCD